MTRIFILPFLLSFIFCDVLSSQTIQQKNTIDFCISFSPVALMQGVYLSHPKYKIGAQFGTLTNRQFYFRQSRLDAFLLSKPLLMPDINGYVFIKTGLIHQFISWEDQQASFIILPVTAGIGTLFSNKVSFTFDIGPGVYLSNSLSQTPGSNFIFPIFLTKPDSVFTFTGAFHLFITIF